MMLKGGQVSVKYKYEIDLKSVGSHIRTARSAAGYTQKQFADYLGIEQKYLSDVERGVIARIF